MCSGESWNSLKSSLMGDWWLDSAPKQRVEFSSCFSQGTLGTILKRSSQFLLLEVLPFYGNFLCSYSFLVWFLLNICPCSWSFSVRRFMSLCTMSVRGKVKFSEWASLKDGVVMLLCIQFQATFGELTIKYRSPLKCGMTGRSGFKILSFLK